MILLIGAFTLLHVFFYLNLTYHWRRLKSPESRDSMMPFSVIVPVRNEAENIGRILQRLEAQDYPKDLYEVIIIDDFSEDDTAKKVTQLSDSLESTIRLIQLNDENKQGKKHALTEGVRQAKHETILTTDADCWMNEGWLRAYNGAFIAELNMVAGPVSIEGKGLFGRLQQVEFAGLIGFGAVTIQKENPSMCSGANLGFRKRAFEEVGGYENNLFTPSGDDEFLLFNIMKKFPHSTKFLKSEKAIVFTPAHTKLSAFMNQRTRWTSKWKYNKNWKVRLSAILFFFDYLIFYMALILGALGVINWMYILTVVVFRCLSLFVFVSPVNRFLQGRSSFIPLLIFQIIYPIHVLFMGLNSIFGSYTWKGRKY